MDVSGGIRERVRCLRGLEKGHSFSGEMVGSGIPFRGSLPSRKGIFPSGDIGMGNVSGKFLLQVYKQCPRCRQCWITIF